MKKRSESCHKLFEINRYFESQKTQRKTIKLPDGLIRPAVFNMRTLATELPQRLLENEFTPVVEPEFFEIMLAQSATGNDLKFKRNFAVHIRNFQMHYMDLVEACPGPWKNVLKRIATRAQGYGRKDRITGNSIECITEEILKARNKGLSNSEVQKVIEALIQNQTAHVDNARRPSLILLESPQSRSLLEKALNLLLVYQEDI